MGRVIKMKQWFRLYLIITVILLGITAFTVAFVDPFFHYHKPIEGLYQYYHREPYQNPGIIKNFDYDTAILGSCMVENFRVSLFENLVGGKVVKIPHQAARTKNLFLYASLLENCPNIKKIYWGIDIWTLDLDSEHENDPVPKYLIDGNCLTDIEYLLNRDAFETYISIILSNTYVGADSMNMDTAWRWAETTEFSQKKALETKTDTSALAGNLLTIEERNYNFEDNMSNRVLNVVKNNPDIKFTFFYPPYSIRLWKEMLDKDIFYERIERTKKLTQELLQLENVEIYNFQNIKDIVANLYNYYDMVHYSGEVNDYMTECFVNGKCRIEKNNYEDEINKLVELVENFDYSLFETEISTCCDLQKYIEKCQDENYMLSIVLKCSDSAVQEQWIIKMNGLGIQKVERNSDSELVWIVDGGKTVISDAMDRIPESIQYDDLQIDFKNETGSAIKINDIKYVTIQEGVNIVIWDKSNNRVIDAANINCMSEEITHY